MAVASDDASPQAGREGQSDDRDASANERARESNRRYRQAHPDRHAASARRWKEAHPERVRELNRRWRAENLERSRELNRESMRRVAARKRRLTDKRRRANEASRRWKEANPERVRAYRREWVAANRDKVNEYYRRYHGRHREELNARATAWRDSQPEKMKHARKAWADRNKERTAEIQRKRRSDPEKYQADLAANAAARRLRVRLERAGLPPKRLHRTTAAERRSNERAKECYFDDPALPERLRQFTSFTVMLTELLTDQGDRMREFAEAYVATRARMGLPAVDAEQLMYARAAELVTRRMKRVDPLTGREVAAAVRSAKAAAASAVRVRQLNEVIGAVQEHVRRHHQRLRADADLENRLRVRKGKPQVLAELLVVRSALQEVLETSTKGRLPVATLLGRAEQIEAAVLAAGIWPLSPTGRVRASRQEAMEGSVTR